MKHFLLTLLLTFIVGVCSAQTEHMKFKGVPMEGTLQTFTSKLKAKGFMPIAVIFPAMDKWGDLERCYSNYKSMLSEKYGEPKDCVEKFQHDYVNDDNSKKYELEMDRCKYYCIFDGDNGEIQLEITHQSMTCYVMLSYFDNANQEKLRKQIMDDL